MTKPGFRFETRAIDVLAVVPWRFDVLGRRARSLPESVDIVRRRTTGCVTRECDAMCSVDGVHDLGGMQGFGAVEVEVDEPVFHEPWERRAVAVAFGAFLAGTSNGGQSRHAIERMDAAHYLESSYYEHWTTGIATMMVDLGLLTLDELEQRSGGAFPLSGPDRGIAPEDPGEDVVAPRFVVGEHVRVRNWHPPGHTRCPRYVRGRQGTVARIDIVASVPDIEAHSPGRRSEPTYSVRFESDELWGEPGDPVHVDLWESYMDPIDER